MTKNSVKSEDTTKQSTPVKSRGVIGTVTSSKMDKTIVVQVMRMVKHPLYGKYMRRYSKMYAHDGENQCREGDVVKIKQSRPISKSKRWILVEIVRQAERAFEASELTPESN